MFAGKLTGDAQLQKAAENMLDYLLHKAPRTDSGIIFHNNHENKIWVDSFYMAPPFLAVAGHHQEAIKQIEGYRKIMLHPEKQLYYHIWDEDQQVFSRKLF